MTRATARAVAKLAGVDPSTVSRVLGRRSPTHSYDPETERRIREAADQLGYRPSQTARALRMGKTCLVGLLVADISSPFFAELSARIERCLRERKYRLLVVNTDESNSLQAELVRDLMAHPVSGIIVSPAGVDGLSEAVEAGIAVVTIDRPAQRMRLPHVGLDDQAAGTLLGEHLRELRYQRVGAVMPDPARDPSIAGRLAGLRQTLGAPLAWSVKRPIGGATEPAIEQIVAKLPDVQAVVGLNLDSTLAALEAIRRAGRKIPDEIGVAGVDDFPGAGVLGPGVTVVAQPIERIARQAVDVLMQRIDKPARAAGATREHEARLLPPTLLERGSLRRI